MKNPFGADEKLTTFTATRAGTVSGKIDLAAFPRIHDVMLSGQEDFFRGELAKDGKSYAISNVPPGAYQLQVYRRKPIDPNRQRDSYETEVIHREAVEVKSGEESVVDLKADEVP